MDDKFFYKVLLLGSSTIGAKTSLLLRIVDNTFDDCQLSTLGFDFKDAMVNTDYGTAKLRIWDTAGQERFRAITENYCKKGFHCFILGYDITNRKSFEDIKNDFYNSIFENLGNQIKNPLIYLVANKIDLQDRIQVTDEEAKSFANEKKIPFFKVSAKTGEGVDILKNHIVKSLIKHFPKDEIKLHKTIISEEKKS